MLLALALIALTEHRYGAEFIRALDGDTFVALVTVKTTTHLPGQDVELATAVVETVRLAGVDAPESQRPRCDQEKRKGLEAKAFLEETLRGQKIVLVTRGPEREKFGRMLSDVEVGGRLLSEMLLERGLARPHGKEKREGWCP